MTFLKIVCPICQKPLLTVEAEGVTPFRVKTEGAVSVRCSNCMDWKNVTEQFDVFKPWPENKPQEGTNAG